MSDAPSVQAKRARLPWRAATVADICELRNGHGFGPEDWTDHGLPIIRIQNLNGRRDFDYFAGQPDPRWLVETGQLLFAWAGTKGVSFGPTVWRGPVGVLNQHIFKVHAKPGVNRDWLYLALRHVTDRIEANAHGFKATLVHVKKSDIDRQPVLVPDIATQQEIAEVLRVWDESIAAMQGLLTNSRRQREALASALLTGSRKLSGASKWGRRAIGELIAESRIPGAPGDVARKLTVKLYGLGVVAKEEKRSGSESTSYYRRRGGQFIYSRLDFLNGAFGLIPTHLDGYESTLDLPAFDFIGDADPRWFFYYVSRPEFYRGHLGLANGGRKARRVNPTDLLRVQIDYPQTDAQRAIADAIDTAVAVEQAYEAELRALKAERQVLMADLLTGKRRVRVRVGEAAA